MNIGSWDWTSDDFRLDQLGNGLFILEMPDLKLAFHETHLIGFALTGKPLGTGSKWVVKHNHWAEKSETKRTQEEEHLRALQGSVWSKEEILANHWDSQRILEGERLGTIEFFDALREAIEHPQILLWLAAAQAKESMKGLE
jgi:hypothetical protein